MCALRWRSPLLRCVSSPTGLTLPHLTSSFPYLALLTAQPARAITQPAIAQSSCVNVLLLRVQDLNRQLVKSDRATVIIPALGFEIPPNTQKGVFTTVEGIMSRAIESLESTQPVRRAVDPDTADSVDKFLTLFRSYLNGEHFPFSLVLDDPSGNSFLENLHAPKHDPHLKVRLRLRARA